MPSPSKKRRPRKPPPSPMRPGWMLNAVLFCVLLGGIGACYVWLGGRKKDKAEQILALHRDIDQYGKRLKEMELLIDLRLAPGDLRARAGKADLNLQPINTGPGGRLVRMLDPVSAASDFPPPYSPEIAGTLQP